MVPKYYVLNLNGKNMIFRKNRAHKSLNRAAEEMVENTVKTMPPVAFGNSVLIIVPKGYRGLLDTTNLKGKIVDFKNGAYRVGSKTETIKN